MAKKKNEIKHRRHAAMIWTWIYRAVMACYLLFVAYILADLFPRFFGNPVVGFLAIGVFGLLMIFRPWQRAGENGERGDRLAK